MKKYLNYILENKSVKDILEYGFNELIYNSHIVSDQVENNLDNFLNNLDVEKFEKRFGRIIKFLGCGVFGSVFQLDNGKVMKITFDFHEAPFLYEYCYKRKIKEFVKIDQIYKIRFGNTFAYLIIRDPIKHINIYNYKEEVRKVKDKMFSISPIWRDTHSSNVGIQNNNIVLYDGFCKKVPVTDNIPILDI